MSRLTVFLDRDGTIIEDPGFLSDPNSVRLLPGAAAAIRRLTDAGAIVVVVTNQSGIARGLLSEADYQTVESRFLGLLSAAGAVISACFHCPHHPEISGACQCRKPGLLHYRQAAERFGVDLGTGWWIGDRMSDVRPATVVGGTGILVQTGQGAKHTLVAAAEGFLVAPDLSAAVDIVLAAAR